MNSLFSHTFDKTINKITNALKQGKCYHSQDKPESGGVFTHNVITNNQETNTNDDESNKSTSPKILITHTTSNKDILVNHIQKHSAIAMIATGSIFMIISLLYFVLRTNQWVNHNAHWFLFGIGFTMVGMAIVLISSSTTKHIYSTKKHDKTNKAKHPVKSGIVGSSAYSICPQSEKCRKHKENTHYGKANRKKK
jgi:hypothetical protein